MIEKLAKLFNSLEGFVEDLELGFNLSQLINLFLLVVFPIHAWAIFLVLRDVGWISERTNAWDAVGVMSYTLVWSLFESIAIFLLITLASLLVSKKWVVEKRFSVLGTILLVTSTWSILGQLFYITGGLAPQPIINFLASSGHPLWFIYGITVPLVIASFLLPVYIFLGSNTSAKKFIGFVDRLILLSGLYLFFDLIGFIIVVIRNI